MSDICVDLSPFGYAILAAVIEADGASLNDMLVFAPPAVGELRTLKEWTDWPQSAEELIDELQSLLDRDLCVRVETPRGYRYVATAHGVTVFRAALHPRRTHRRSAS